MLLPPICFKCSYTSPHYAHQQSLVSTSSQLVFCWSLKQKTTYLLSFFFFLPETKKQPVCVILIIVSTRRFQLWIQVLFPHKKVLFFSELGTRLKKIKTDLGGSREASWTQNKVVIQGIFSTAWEHKLQQLVRASVSSQQIRNYLKYEHALKKKQKNSEQRFELERRGGCPCRPVLIDTQRSGAKWGGAPRSRPNSGE